MNIIDNLIQETIRKKNPTVVGLDPDFKKIPKCYKELIESNGDEREQVSNIIYQFNRDIIDTVHTLVPAVKPQIAFYEKYGAPGILAFEKTVQYAHSKNLIVIEDGKRNDIGNTALAYAQAHLGVVEVLSGKSVPSIDVDFLTVTPFLGSDSIKPFIDICINNNKGIFILVKTSNFGSGEIQDIQDNSGNTVSQLLAKNVSSYAKMFTGKTGYSSIGAVVGATYPEEAKILRKIMPISYFLVPGYGAQGGNASDILPCFNEDGLGAIVNSSRGLLYSHMSETVLNTCTKKEYLESVFNATKAMQQEIYNMLKSNCSKMSY